MTRLTLITFMALIFSAWSPMTTMADQQIGIGAHYWRAVENIDVDDIDEDGLSWLVAYQFVPGPFVTLELDVEVFAEDFAGLDDSVLAPQAYILVGSGLYAGVGVGRFYTDGSFEETFYKLRAGIELELIENLMLDINLNYQFMDWEDLNDELDNVDTDTVTLGAAIRIAL